MKRLTKEQEEKGIELIRKEIGISGDATMGTSDTSQKKKLTLL